MKVGIITLTLNRLFYTYHCLRTLKEKAGYPIKHVVVDNGSTDGTAEWLKEEGYDCILNKENAGITKALRQGVEKIGDVDLIIKFDSDCEVVTPNIIAEIVKFFEKPNDYFAVSPRVEGIVHKPQIVLRETVNGFNVGKVGVLGGIFRAIRANDFLKMNKETRLNDKSVFRYCDTHKLKFAYLTDLVVNHFETTPGQAKRYPNYFSKKYVY